MSSSMRQRDWMFSSVASGGAAGELAPCSVASVASNMFSIESTL